MLVPFFSGPIRTCFLGASSGCHKTTRWPTTTSNAGRRQSLLCRSDMFRVSSLEGGDSRAHFHLGVFKLRGKNGFPMDRNSARRAERPCWQPLGGRLLSNSLCRTKKRLPDTSKSPVRRVCPVFTTGRTASHLAYERPLQERWVDACVGHVGSTERVVGSVAMRYY